MLPTWRLSLFMALLPASAMSACASGGPHQWVVTHASAKLECAQEQIVLTPSVAPMYHQVSGCGKTDFMMETCIERYGCKLNTVGDLRQRASFDLGCDEPELEAVRIDQDTMGVTGCGNRASYKGTWSGWVLNGSTGTDTQPAAAPPTDSAG